ncbi:MAG: EamA family transporter, partial [Planctomycetota bacterium]
MQRKAGETQADYDRRRRIAFGLFAALGANFLWGVTPLYYQPVLHLPPATIVGVRCLASIPLIVLVALLVGEPLRVPRKLAAVLVFNGLLLLANWLMFTYCVATKIVVQASLAYFLTPLVMVGLGALLLGERLRRMQLASLTIAAFGCGLLVLDAGNVTWIAVTMASVFGLYSTLRRKFDVPAVGGLFWESLVCVPAAIGLLLWFGLPGMQDAADPHLGFTWLVLIGSACFTVFPLTLFGAATRRLSMRT